jgi:hypothetical protein
MLKDMHIIALKPLERARVNILEAIRGEFGKNTYDKISKSSSTWMQTNHRKEQVFIIFVATQIIFIQK